MQILVFTNWQAKKGSVTIHLKVIKLNKLNVNKRATKYFF
jgi:hypothetical protein